jgi:hypothetical protein
MYINVSPVIPKTLTSVMGKVYEKVVLSRITKMLNNIGMTFPDPLQFGFVPILVVFDIHVYQ